MTPAAFMFSLLAGANIVALVAMIRWRRIGSYEGSGLLLLLVVVASDALGVAIASFSTGVCEPCGGRILPGVIHLIGLAALSAGLFLVNARSRPIPAPALDSPAAHRLRQFAVSMAVVGVLMKAVSLYGEGITSLGDYFARMYEYNAAERRFGSVLDSGSGIVVLALVIIGVIAPRRNYYYLAVCAVASFAISSSRADFLSVLFMWVVVAAVLNPSLMLGMLRPVPLSMVLLGTLISAGIKPQVRSAAPGHTVDTSFSALLWNTTDRLSARFSDEGLYDGYSNLIDHLNAGSAPYWRGRVIAYTFTSAIPIVLYPGKPEHPFRDIGWLVYRDRHSSVEDVSAPTLIGYAYADFGVYSLVLYLMAGGLVLGAIRRYIAATQKPALLLWYLHFALVDGSSNFIHNGLLGIVVGLILSTVVVGAAVGGLAVWQLLTGKWGARSRRRRMAMPRPLAS